MSMGVMSPAMAHATGQAVSNASFGGTGPSPRLDPGITSDRFQTTFTRELQSQHGAYSQPIFIAAEGNSGERFQALQNIAALLQKHSVTEDAAQKQKFDAKTMEALCDVVALRCADTNNRVQLQALEAVPLLVKTVSSAAVDASSPRWVSCVTTALSSSYQAVHGAAMGALASIMHRSSDANLRNMNHHVAMTCSTVRNERAKVALLGALGEVIVRHRSLLGGTKRFGSLSGGDGALAESDVEYSLDTALRIYANDTRDVVRRPTGALLCLLMEYGYQNDAKPILESPRLPKEHIGAVKALFDNHRKHAESHPESTVSSPEAS